MMTPKDIQEALKNWGDLQILKPLEGGHRNSVYLVEDARAKYVAKTTRRSEASLRWLEPIYLSANKAGFITPDFIRSVKGTIAEDSVTLETFIEGEAITELDRPEIFEQLGQFHCLTTDVAQRPGFASSDDLLRETSGGDVDLSAMPKDLVTACREAWEVLLGESVSAIHGDLNPSNILKNKEGEYALIDWDEARVDANVFDAFALFGEMYQHPKRKKLERAALAWEIAVCWQIEPEYAQSLLPSLL